MRPPRTNAERPLPLVERLQKPSEAAPVALPRWTSSIRAAKPLLARLLHTQSVGALTGRAAFASHGLRSRNRLAPAVSDRRAETAASHATSSSGRPAALRPKRSSSVVAGLGAGFTRNDQQAVAVLGQIHTVRRARLLRAAQSLADARAAVVAPPAEAGLVWFRRKRRARKLARGELQVVFDGGEVVRTIGMEQ
jgi:hypothetical protein